MKTHFLIFLSSGVFSAISFIGGVMIGSHFRIKHLNKLFERKHGVSMGHIQDLPCGDYKILSPEDQEWRALQRHGFVTRVIIPPEKTTGTVVPIHPLPEINGPIISILELVTHTGYFTVRPDPDHKGRKKITFV